MGEHAGKILGGAILVAIGTFFGMAAMGEFGIILNLIGGIMLFIGVIGAGVQAGNRELLDEMRRSRAAGQPTSVDAP